MIFKMENKSTQYTALISVNLLVLILVFIQLKIDDTCYRLLGGLPVIPVFIIIMLISLILTVIMLNRTPFFIICQNTPSQMIQASAFAFLFFILMASVDILEPFPPGINASLPSGFFYYPSMGFLVEILFLLAHCLGILPFENTVLNLKALYK